jgi:Spy/CpxP family protein refolding chaperone
MRSSIGSLDTKRRAGTLSGIILWVIAVMPGGTVQGPIAAVAADFPGDPHMQQSLESAAAQAPDRPDHDFSENSIRHLLNQAKELNLTQDQVERIKDINDRYVRARSLQDSSYKRAEMDALKLMHDRRSSLLSVETALQKADEAHTKLRMTGIKALREATDVLRPEQYANWRQAHTAGQFAQTSPQEGAQAEIERIAPH